MVVLVQEVLMVLPNCDAILISGGVGQITIENLNAASELVEIIGAPTNWRTIEICKWRL